MNPHTALASCPACNSTLGQASVALACEHLVCAGCSRPEEAALRDRCPFCLSEASTTTTASHTPAFGSILAFAQRLMHAQTQAAGKMASAAQLCESYQCGTEPVLVCTTGCGRLCAHCAAAHAKDLFCQDHRVRRHSACDAYAHANALLASPTCNLHNGAPLTRFCLSCPHAPLLCPECAYLDDDHASVHRPLPDAVDAMRLSLAAAIPAAAANLDVWRRDLERVIRQRDKMQQRFDRVSQEIDAVANECMRQIRQERDDMVAQLRQQQESLLRPVVRLAEQLERQTRCMGHAVHLAEATNGAADSLDTAEYLSRLPYILHLLSTATALRQTPHFADALRSPTDTLVSFDPTTCVRLCPVDDPEAPSHPPPTLGSLRFAAPI